MRPGLQQICLETIGLSMLSNRRDSIPKRVDVSPTRRRIRAATAVEASRMRQGRQPPCLAQAAEPAPADRAAAADEPGEAQAAQRS
jgi:hypothetical protein